QCGDCCNGKMPPSPSKRRGREKDIVEQGPRERRRHERESRHRGQDCVVAAGGELGRRCHHGVLQLPPRSPNTVKHEERQRRYDTRKETKLFTSSLSSSATATATARFVTAAGDTSPSL
ncbi:hypothetical protein S83_022677, partial [Arachis hypogaea]